MTEMKLMELLVPFKPNVHLSILLDLGLCILRFLGSSLK